MSTLARTAYQTFEPFHITAYFNPELGGAMKDTGLDGFSWYVGARAAPLGPCPASVVAATFYNFNPAMIERAWPAAVEAGLEKVSDRRWEVLDTVLSGALGSLANDRAVVELAVQLHDIGDRAVFAGRPLSAAWHSVEHPDVPHLALWHAIAVLREWRGDGHLAALVDAELDPIEAVVFHEAQHPVPAPGRRVLGKKLTQITREWSNEEWSEAADRLASRGLVTPGENSDTLTDAGATLDAHIEERTDALASPVWADVPDAEGLIAQVRPYVKAVIDAGILPGTKKG